MESVGKKTFTETGKREGRRNPKENPRPSEARDSRERERKRFQSGNMKKDAGKPSADATGA